MKLQENEIFALHLDGKIITTKTWKEFCKKNGKKHWYGAVPKKLYLTMGHAKAAINYLPDGAEGRVTIVRYVPEDL